MTPEAPPPWDWTQASPAELRENWRELVRWVEWLRTAYSGWVSLSDCWPRHEPVRSELCAFMWWHRRALQAADDPEDLIRWHGELRRSADAWARLAACDHGPQDPRLVEDRDAHRRRLTDHLRLALEEWKPPCLAAQIGGQRSCA